MSETTYAKCACAQCGGHIEFPVEAVGQSVACPHCGTLTALAVAAPAKKSGRRKGLLPGAALLVLLVLALVGMKYWRPGRTQKTDRSLPVKIISFERATANNPGAVVGVVENRTSRPRQGVRVEIELLNARGEPLWSTSAFAPALEPNKSWSFRASVVDPNAVTGRVARVQETGR